MRPRAVPVCRRRTGTPLPRCRARPAGGRPGTPPSGPTRSRGGRRSDQLRVPRDGALQVGPSPRRRVQARRARARRSAFGASSVTWRVPPPAVPLPWSPPPRPAVRSAAPGLPNPRRAAGGRRRRPAVPGGDVGHYVTPRLRTQRTFLVLLPRKSASMTPPRPGPEPRSLPVRHSITRARRTPRYSSLSGRPRSCQASALALRWCRIRCPSRSSSSHPRSRGHARTNDS